VKEKRKEFKKTINLGWEKSKREDVMDAILRQSLKQENEKQLPAPSPPYLVSTGPGRLKLGDLGQPSWRRAAKGAGHQTMTGRVHPCGGISNWGHGSQGGMWTG
jgi:hypothetical protein